MWSLAEADPVTAEGSVLLIPGPPGVLEEYGEALTGVGLLTIRPPSRRASLSRLRSVDLAVVEVSEGDEEGWEICRTIRSRFPHLPLVVVSRNGTERLGGRILEMGAADHVCLPIAPELLAARIRSRMGRGRAHLESLRSAERYRRVVQVAPVPLFILESGWVREANQHLSELVGVSIETLTGETALQDLVTEEDHPSLTRALERWDENRMPKLRLPVRVRRKEGAPREAELTLARMSADEATVHVGSLVDVTRRRRALRTRQIKEEYFRSLIEGAHDLILVLDSEGTVGYASPSLERVAGFRPDELEGQPIHSFLHPDDADPAQHLLERMVGSSDPAVTSRCRLRNAAGEWRVMEFTARDLLENMAVSGIVINARDVSEQQVAEDAMRASEERFRLLVEGSRDVFFYVRRTDGELVYLSPSVAGVLGHSTTLLAGQAAPWLERGNAGVGADGAPAGASGRLAAVEHQDGRTVTLELVESSVAGAKDLVQGFARDVSEREVMQEALRNAAFQDALTGLPNRALFTDRVRHAIARIKRHPDEAFALLFLDLDRFKVINDSLGHIVGDGLLVAVSDRLKIHLRPEDTLARFGGDEFAILLEDVAGPADAPRVARRINEVLAVPFDLNGYEVYTSASIGIVMGSASTSSPESLLQAADMAMYRAKATGGNSFELYDQPMHAEAVRRLQLESQLRKAVERDELCLHYQPVVRLSDGAIAGVEALLRWNHPIYGVIAPADFIGLAEETGFITEIGEWALRSACAAVAEWQRTLDRPDLFVSVNLSSRQLRDSSVLRQVQNVLREHALTPGSLKLEITESVLVQSHDRASRVLRELMNRGVEIYLDDFGTGYASLSYLHSLPLNGLKIDGSFVSRMHRDARYAVLVESTMNIAKGLGLSVVAEGIEESAQADALVGLACDYAQGYHFSPPVTPDEIPAILRRNGLPITP